MTGDLAIVTGARGFVGWHVAKRLLQAGAKVRGLTRSFDAPLPEDDPGIEWHEGNLTTPSTLPEALAGCRFLFHVAADYRYWAPNPVEIYASNVDGTANILDAAWKAGVEKVVYTSTSAILAPKKHGEQNEAELTCANQLRGPYRKSKLLAYLEIEKRSRDGWPIVTVMPTAVIGPCDLRPTPTGRIIVEFLHGRVPVDARIGLNFVDVRDVATGHLLALDRGISGQRYLIGCQNLWLRDFLARLEPFTTHRAPRFVPPYWLAWTIAQVNERIATVRKQEPFAAIEAVEAKHQFFSCSKAIFQIGYEPSGLELALRDAVEYFRSRGMA